MTAKYAAIAADRDRFPVDLMFTALGVSVSGFYAAEARQHRPARARVEADERLRIEVRAAHAKSHRRYGAPRVHQELRAQGSRMARKRVARLMREGWLAARRVRRFVRTIDSAQKRPIAPNLLARRFALEAVGGLDRVWTSDITYVPARAGFLYLAGMLGLGSRPVVGWAMHGTLEDALVLDALRCRSRSASPRRAPCNTRSRQSVCRRRVPSAARRARAHLQHESEGRLLGRRSGRELLRRSSTSSWPRRTSPRGMRHDGRSSSSSRSGTIANADTRVSGTSVQRNTKRSWSSGSEPHKPVSTKSSQVHTAPPSSLTADS